MRMPQEENFPIERTMEVTLQLSMDSAIRHEGWICLVRAREAIESHKSFDIPRGQCVGTAFKLCGKNLMTESARNQLSRSSETRPVLIA